MRHPTGPLGLLSRRKERKPGGLFFAALGGGLARTLCRYLRQRAAGSRLGLAAGSAVSQDIRSGLGCFGSSDFVDHYRFPPYYRSIFPS